MSNGTKVVKRDGHSEVLNLEKVHKMTEEACEGLAGVSASQVEIQSGLQFYDGITTGEIQEILVRSASDLIDLDSLIISSLLQDFCFMDYISKYLVSGEKGFQVC